MDNLTISISHSGPGAGLQGSKNLSWISNLPWLLTALFAYPFAQQYLRYQRLEAMKKKYNYHTRQSLAGMTDKEAWEIVRWLAQLEFCTMFEKGKLSWSATVVTVLMFNDG